MAFKKTIIKKEINATTVNRIRTIAVTGTGRVALYLRFVLRHLFLIPQKGEQYREKRGICFHSIKFPVFWERSRTIQ